MGLIKGLYNAEFPIGTKVYIKGRRELEAFASERKLHNPLDESQIEYAGHWTTVVWVGFYHGGDELYRLADAPGIWHECCLEVL